MEVGEIILMYGVLSSPLELTGDFEKDIDIAYEYFSTAINDRKKRPTLFDKEVFIEAHEIIEGSLLSRYSTQTKKKILIKITENMLGHILIHNEKRLPQCDNLGLLLQHGR